MSLWNTWVDSNTYVPNTYYTSTLISNTNIVAEIQVSNGIYTLNRISENSDFSITTPTSIDLANLNAATSISGAKITILGKNAFDGCTGLTSIIIPDGITTIGGTSGFIAGTFNGCTGLTSLVIPASVDTIFNGMFNGCNATAVFLCSADSLDIGSLSQVYYDPLKNTGGWDAVNFTTIAPISLEPIKDGRLSFMYDQYLAANGPPAYYPAFIIPPAPPASVPCFLADAPVLTPVGYRRIDSLKVGDLVTTPKGPMPIQRVKITHVVSSSAVNPYIIKKGQFGATQRLLISPNHHIKTETGMVKAHELGLRQEEMSGSFDYYNLELPDWSNMIIAGVTVESLAPKKRIIVTMQEFKAFITQRYGAITPDLYKRIQTSTRILQDGRVVHDYVNVSR